MNTADTPIQLTFGVELEFLVPFNCARYAPYVDRGELLRLWKSVDSPSLSYYDKLKRLVRLEIIHVLRQKGLSVNDYHTPSHQRWTVSSDGSVKPTDAELAPQMRGERDEAAWPQECPALGYADVEVKGRAMFYSLEALAEVHAAVAALTDHRPAFVNGNTGLHVHVGNQFQGFPLQTVKNIATFFSVFEPQFNQLHPRNRLTNDFCVAPRRSFPVQERNPVDMIRRIHELKTLEDLVQLFGSDEDGIPNHNKCYNFNNLVYGVGGKTTIEFRQHEGTLDPLAVLKWVELTCDIVGAAHKSDSKEFLAVVLSLSNNANRTIVDLLRTLQLVNLADYYQSHCYLHSVEELEEDAKMEEE